MTATDDHLGSVDRGAFLGMGVDAPVYLTRQTPGIGGRIKAHDEDFLVDEIPLYEPKGSGDYIFMYIEKRGLSTIQMRDALAGHFGVHQRDIGHAGLKDKRAITRQVVSVYTPGRTPEDFPSLDHPKLTVQWIDMHDNRLERGHLAGNRFVIKVRGVQPTAVVDARQTLRTLADTGLPNRFGLQRFGYLRNNHLIGRSMILGNAREALDLMLGIGPVMPDLQREAREAYAAGDLGHAFAAMPRVFKGERQALRVLSEGGDHAKALGAIDPTAAGFYISSFQSALFNAMLND
ncbi:MAG: tRNA pseudouridine(13) synthase TruD, partial [Planctomycetota bacterium]